MFYLFVTWSVPPKKERVVVSVARLTKFFSPTFVAGCATDSFLRNNSIQVLVELVVAELHVDKPLPEKKRRN